MLIMIQRKLSFVGHLRLADFGLSRRLERGGRAFTICGTIQYMGKEKLPELCMLKCVNTPIFRGLFFCSEVRVRM